MVDSLGYRKKFAVIAPSTNTSVQPEFDDMRPVGVTNHFSRITIPDNPVHSDADFLALIDNIRASIMESVDSVMTCGPDYLVMGMSAETFWDGLDGSVKLQKRIEERSGVKVAMGSDACQAALKMYGNVKRIGVVTPYMPVGDAQVQRFFTECGYEVVNLKGLKCQSPMLIAHASEKELRDAIIEVDGEGIEAIVQVGTNLAMARLAGIAEFWLDKPVIAINTATYWWALRQNGITDKVQGFGTLLSHH
ncbi:arylmalonate decarboxylase [Rhizobium sp. RU36D]|uniref:maleate cis-trans isomerase family protein n=1 Tax=Rhizobium sp. RU36D TaxID=1907415 RepID=UPI0009D84A01|nr:arylmalonate decarboxylase [Rhizobium sp. RU36D]SMC98136.1 maleate isomerase [Rhizobium sp. RU36D]